jgi:benzaldehyde dehydrogenase (NAD)
MTFLDKAAWPGRLFDGSWIAASGIRPIVEPATGDSLGELGTAAVPDVERAAVRAAQAQIAWAATSFAERAAVLRRAAQLFEQHAAEIAGWIVRESGATGPKGDLEAQVASVECFEAAALPGMPYGELLPTTQPRLSFSRQVPVGVVSVIAPFNFPLILSIRSVAPALALGNAVLLKPDLRTGMSGGVVLARVFQEAGLPPGLLHLLPGGVDVAEATITAPPVRVVSFTGSTRAGRSVGALAAQQLTRCHLELGGNNALVVLDDADVAAAASCGAWGSFLHQGQICMAVGRHLVHESIYPEYVAKLAAKAEALPAGNGTRSDVALGPIIDESQLKRVQKLVRESIAAGARLVAGGVSTGPFFPATVLADCTDMTPAYAEEIFGPVACVRSFRTDDEAVALASAGDYGLSLGIITADSARGLAFADRVPTGLIHINDQTVNDDPNAPFGGFGASGYGRFGGARANIDAFTETQWLTVRSQPAQYPF